MYCFLFLVFFLHDIDCILLEFLYRIENDKTEMRQERLILQSRSSLESIKIVNAVLEQVWYAWKVIGSGHFTFLFENLLHTYLVDSQNVIILLQKTFQ